MAGKRLVKYIKDYVIFDLETTGVSSEKDDIVEISALKVKDGKVVSEFSTLVNPGRPIPWQANQVNNIYDDMVADAPMIKDALRDFLDFAGDYVLCGHNIHSFDMKFIIRDAEKLWGEEIENDYVDTLPMARIVLPGLKHHKLGDLAELFGISTVGAHRALADCRMNQEVYERLGKVIKEHGDYIRSCRFCGQLMKKKTGKYGEFMGCMGFPDCRYTENI